MPTAVELGEHPRRGDADGDHLAGGGRGHYPVRHREQAAGVRRAGSVGSDLGREGDGDEAAQRECPAACRSAERGARMLAHAPSCKFAMWARGYMGRHARAGKSKAVHALARRVGKALYYCHLKNEPFDDSNYQALLDESSYPLCPVEKMGLSPGVVRKLKVNGLRTSRQVVEAFYSDLGRRPGCGKVTVQDVATWIDRHRSRSPDKTRKPKGPEASGDPPRTEG